MSQVKAPVALSRPYAQQSSEKSFEKKKEREFALKRRSLFSFETYVLRAARKLSTLFFRLHTRNKHLHAPTPTEVYVVPAEGMHPIVLHRLHHGHHFVLVAVVVRAFFVAASLPRVPAFGCGEDRVSTPSRYARSRDRV